MPVLPVAPYPTAAAVMNRARAFVNDSYQGGKGRILTNTAPFSMEYLNSALEELQERIRNNGVITLTRDNVIVGPIPPLDNPDPAQQIKLTYTGLFVNGQFLATPVLPGDLRSIEKVWERQVGSGLPFMPMTQPMEGLPSVYQGPWQRIWEYREDAICMPGSTSTEELRLRYTAALPIIGPDVIVDGDESWTTTTINILSSVNTLGSLVGCGYVIARNPGSPAAQAMVAQAEKYMRLIVNKYVRRAQHVKYNRAAYGETQNQLSRPNNNLPY
jgi:hypothetical protein